MQVADVAAGTDPVSSVTAVVATVITAVALLVGVLAEIRTRKAARRAAVEQAANDAAAKKAADEKEARDAAAGQAAMEAAAKKAEVWFVDWEAAWDIDRYDLVLTNKGSDPALEVKATVSGPGTAHQEFANLGEGAAGESVRLRLPAGGPFEKAARRNVFADMDPGDPPPGSRSTKLKVTIFWKTRLGQAGRSDLKAEARY